MATASDDALTPKRTHGRKRVWVWVATAIVAVVGLIALPWAGCVHQADRAVDAEVQAARSAGYPMSMEELRAWYPEPEGEHAGVLYERAFAAMVEADVGQRSLLPVVGDVEFSPRGERWRDEWLEATEGHLERNAEALALLREAAAMGPAWFEVPFDALVGLMPWLGELRGAARLAQLEALWLAQMGETDAALEAVEALWAMSDALADEPVLISHLVRISVIALAAEATERVVAELPFSTEQLARLRIAAAGARDEGRGIGRALAGERARMHMVFERIARGEEEHDYGGGELLAAIGLLQRDHAAYLRFMAWAIEQAESTPRRPAPQEEHDARFEQLPFYAMLTRIMVPALSPAIDTDLTVTSRLDVLDVGLAAAMFEREHGRWPSSLEALVGEYLDAVPMDAFDGEALKYRRTDSGAVVYSIGRDRTDTGGRELNDRGERRAGREGTDITFTLGEAQRELWPEQWE